MSAALRSFTRPRPWLGLWIFGWALCIALSLVSPPRLGVDLPEGDKIGHLLAYGLLSAWAVWLFARRRAHWLAALSLLALGVLLEFAQGAWTTDRMYDLRDAVADALGIALGQLAAFGRGPRALQWLDARLFASTR